MPSTPPTRARYAALLTLLAVWIPVTIYVRRAVDVKTYSDNAPPAPGNSIDRSRDTWPGRDSQDESDRYFGLGWLSTAINILVLILLSFVATLVCRWRFVSWWEKNDTHLQCASAKLVCSLTIMSPASASLMSSAQPWLCCSVTHMAVCILSATSYATRTSILHSIMVAFDVSHWLQAHMP